MVSVNWHYNEEDQVWEGTTPTHTLQVTVEPNIDYVVYIASIEPMDDSMPIVYAPTAFKELEDAKAWCEQRSGERLEEEKQIPQGDRDIASYRSK
jgi:hypothetical protein